MMKVGVERVPCMEISPVNICEIYELHEAPLLFVEWPMVC